jgi:hypothetical protein
MFFLLDDECFSWTIPGIESVSPVYRGFFLLQFAGSARNAQILATTYPDIFGVCQE